MKTIQTWIFSFASLGLISMAPSASFASFEFSPIITTLAPSGPNASASFSVQNADETKLPVQISIVHRNPDIDGKEDLKDTPDIEELFQIFPAQIVLAPKERRTVRINWIGDPNVKQELAFRVIAEELPINLEDPNKTYTKPVAKIRIATKYVGSLYISPKGATSDLVASGFPSEDKKKLILEIQNKGTRHQPLARTKVKLKPLDKNTEFEIPAKISAVLNRENVLAGKTRRISLPWPDNVPMGPAQVILELPKE
ncbi:MAG: hypothetical protein A2X94_08500 [Bdellovibrionales bacterium GWB1_55_8]|nr:MAG: hypothetical protein A2X94_08500 [Bdellovibrionales bacterium GWB1_55_8]